MTPGSRDETPPPAPTLRWGVTLAAPLAVWGLGHVPLPGLSPMVESLRLSSSTVSIVALGLSPFVTGCILVELAARLVPAWNALRRDGRAGRASLRRAAMMTTIVVALLHALLTVRWMATVGGKSFGGILADDGAGAQWLIVATLVGGTMLLVLLAHLVDRFGLGNGVAVLLAGAIAIDLAGVAGDALGALRRDEVAARDVTTLALELTVLVAAMSWLFRRYRRGVPDATGRPPLRDPAAGLLPALVLTLNPMALLHEYGPAYGIDWSPKQGTFEHGAAVAAGAMVWCALLTPLFQWRTAGARALAAAAARSAGLVLLVVVADELFVMRQLAHGIDVAGVAVLVACVLDLWGEARARAAEPTLVPIYTAPSVAAADRALDALAAANVPAFARTVHLRALFQFFGPHLAIDVLVPAARADDAIVALPPA